ncbi:polyphosphate kinase 1 [Myxococcus sp. MISCRS1]|jgi:polyphosphate kinase|uniref:polyphosphate kinase 1 n=1 Tax=Myxococcus TaxID=32 RepID=UPI001CBC3FF6|nr:MULTISPECIES: polyphosphate kinase 1 [unclassified Myxococcus]MBZ4399214.1 polyphosphate kinase 1 [Myxococcus sp. AS-1-15]MBZ4411579.1 polyphosphate kinase 1 [Myxococcus sp. XM-1-1-1]MCY0999711.1 polyphosphate kinase 1 [Myxococcus sp. MISCRS1]BDT30396.1 polyphosphate kinase 1 [Myxococcus sp. MH1]
MAKRGAAGRSTQKPLERDVLPAGTDPEEGLFFNRELSWLAFNDRVLQLAESADEPLLERLKFVAIYARNLDEFFMIRVARLHEQVRGNVARLVPDGASPGQTLDKLHEGIFEQSKRHSAIFEKLLRPALAEKGLRILSAKDLDAEQRAQVDQRFKEQIFPVLTPLAIGLGRHFPYISNLSLSLAVLLRDPDAGEESVARVKVPKELLPRFLPLKNNVFVPLEEVIAQHLGDLFPGMEVLSWSLFRVTRDADFTVSEDAEDLLKAVETELRQRRFGDVIRLEVQAGMSPKLLEPLVEALGLESRQVYEEQGLLGLGDLQAIAFAPGFPELKDPPWTPVTQPRLRPDSDAPEGTTVMAAMRRGDLLVHHPYDSFGSSVERFVTEAVADPDVLAIKQTVYRTSDSSPLVPALITATENGKQAVCMVELKARFDERTNIKWANALEEAGVHVVYGIPSLKTHAKAILIVRREGERVRHYVHVGTGNYNPKTARLYTDMGLFTTDPDIGADVADLFNYLTGFGRPKSFRKLLVAPLTMREGLLEHIKATVVAHTLERPARIQMKMNALVDPIIIRALYDASRAGVKVDLNVRGICCLRPGVPGVSENIRVVSTLGRFLEHARLYLFERGQELRCYIGSADLMPRNLDHRVEILAPVEDPTLAAQVRDSLERSLADNTHAWELQADGTWKRLVPPAGGEKRWAQGEIMERATRAAQFPGARPLP